MVELRRIMSVEDDEDILVLVDLALGTVGGFELEGCRSGREALEKIANFAPQLLILDAVMPEMDGLQTLAAIRELPDIGNVPAVFMTAKVQPAARAEFLAAGALEVLPKPFDPMALSNEVRAIWSKYQEGSMRSIND